MIEVKITSEMIEEAKKEAENLGVLKNSVTRGEGNIIGILGEMVTAKATGSTRASTRDYDLLRPDGKTSDVKSKKCSSPPEPHFQCSVSDFNTRQKCDYYVFVRVLRDFSKAWIVGELPKSEYFQKAIFVQQGQFDPANNWRCKADCYNLEIRDLNEVVSA